MNRDVTIRAITRGDASVLQQYASDERVASTCNVPYPYPEDGAVRWIETAIRGWDSGTRHTFTIVNNGEFVGVVRLVRGDAVTGTAELDYFVAVPFWNRGIATEAARQAVEYAFRELGLSTLTSRCLVRNPASARVLEKNGFRGTEIVTESNPDSRFHCEPWQVFCLTRSEWERRRCEPTAAP